MPANIIDEIYVVKTHNEVASILTPVLSTVSVYPNPTNNQFILNLNLAQPDEISVDIHAITGQYIGKILDKSLQDAGQQKVTIDLRYLNLPKGTYILKISGKSINQNRLLIVAR
ncbi:MAG: T9SS type A sorting domain-containing protein [Sphingobacteriales bacterium]|nr:T9SS type A sorting domain-containing protein [Sphingobacteriales bacterium]